MMKQLMFIDRSATYMPNTSSGQIRETTLARITWIHDGADARGQRKHGDFLRPKSGSMAQGKAA